MSQTGIRLVTWNLRYDSIPDTIRVEETLSSLPGKLEPPKHFSNVNKEQPWSTRRIKVAKQLLNGNVVLAGNTKLSTSLERK